MITILRHNQLKSPFDNYEKLDFQDLIHLANRTVSPEISNIPTNPGIHRLIPESTDLVVITSTEKRTQETAKLLGLEVSETNHHLDELRFPIERLLSESEYRTYGMAAVRRAVFAYFLLPDTMQTVTKTLIYLNEMRKQKGDFVLITHGFLMRFLHLTLAERKELETIDFETLAKAKNFGYMEGFTVENT